MNWDEREAGLCVQIGAGNDLIEGWVNTQKNEADLTTRLPFGDASCQAVTISHVLMYLDIYEASFALRELHRILSSGGSCDWRSRRQEGAGQGDGGVSWLFTIPKS